MVSLVSLWLPILLSAVFVFVASSIIHMLLPYHKGDFKTVPNEDQVRAALKPFNIPPGDYAMPRPKDMSDMKSPEFQAKMNEGPVIYMTVRPSGTITMGKELTLWFVYCVIVAVFAAYLTSRTVAPGTEYLPVFRVAATIAFAGYGLALLQRSIWYGESWSTTFKSVFDALIYACLTGGTLGWLWPS